jgi:hypothetical protein
MCTGGLAVRVWRSYQVTKSSFIRGETLGTQVHTDTVSYAPKIQSHHSRFIRQNTSVLTQYNGFRQYNAVQNFSCFHVGNSSHCGLVDNDAMYCSRWIGHLGRPCLWLRTWRWQQNFARLRSVTTRKSRILIIKKRCKTTSFPCYWFQIHTSVSAPFFFICGDKSKIVIQCVFFFF